MPLVSVIVPGFQAGGSISRCLTALCGQRLTDSEILCIDDGSPDNTGAIMEAFAQKDPRVRVWHTPNQGVSRARNLGVAQARGEWLAFVDADDTLPPGALGALHGVSSGMDAVTGDYEQVGPEGACTYHRLPPQPNRTAILTSLVEGEGSYNTLWGKLYRRALWTEQGVYLDDSLRIGEDALANLKFFYGAKAIAHVAVPVYRYHDTPGSAMSSVGAKVWDANGPYLRAMSAFLAQVDLNTAYFADLTRHAVALTVKQYGKEVPKEVGKEAAALCLQGVRSGELSWKHRGLYTLLATGQWGTACRLVLRGENHG